MTTPTFNKFKSTTIYGAFSNLDYEDNSVQASANIQRNLTVGGNIYGAKLYYNNSDISTLFASTLMPNFLSSINIGVTDPLLTSYNLTISNASGSIAMNTYNGAYPIKIKSSNLQFSKNNGTNYYDVLTTNTGALLSGATFTGNVYGLTAITTDNSTLLATTAFVRAQNYLTSASLSSSYASTVAGVDVNIACSDTFPNTNSGGKRGLGFFWNKSGGYGETNLLTYGQGGFGGLNIWASNTTNLPSKMVEFLPNGSTFENIVTVKNTFTIKQPLSTSSAVLQFSTDDGNSRANIYSSVGDNVFSFDIQSAYNTNGFRWQIGNTGLVLMSLDINGNLTNNSATLKQLVFTSAGTTSTPYLTTNSGNNLVLSTATDNGLQFSTPSGGSSITANGSTLKINGNLITTGSISTPSTTIATQIILIGGTQNLTFPLSSSYLIQTQLSALVNLPTITSQYMGIEVLFIKNSGSCTISPSSGNVMINASLSQSSSVALSQYMKLVSTRLSSGVFGWMIIGSG